MEMRRSVWKKVPGTHDLFLDEDHNRRYGILGDLLVLMEHMTDREFAGIVTRIETLANAINSQTKLF